MARGGDRSSQAAANGKAMGRPRKRLTDASLAARILEKAKAEEKWLKLLESPNEHTVLRTLEYLTDRVEGKAGQTLKHSGTLDLNTRRERVRTLLTRLAGKS